MGSLGRLLEAAWGCFDNFLQPLGPILESLARLCSVLEGLGGLEVSSRRFSEARGCLGGDITFGVGFLMLCECLQSFSKFSIEN